MVVLVGFQADLRLFAFGFFVSEIWSMGQWEGFNPIGRGVNHVQKTFYACSGLTLKKTMHEKRFTIQSKKATN